MCGVAGLAETFPAFTVTGPLLPDVSGFQIPPDSIFPPQLRSSYRAHPLWSWSGGLAKQAQSGQEDSSSNIRQGNTGLKCVSLNARSIIDKKNELNIMVHDSDPHIIGTTESWANKDISDAELGL